jgi:hypothetical protein
VTALDDIPARPPPHDRSKISIKDRDSSLVIGS